MKVSVLYNKAGISGLTGGLEDTDDMTWLLDRVLKAS